jgi:hypothetical protein
MPQYDTTINPLWFLSESGDGSASPLNKYHEKKVVIIRYVSHSPPLMKQTSFCWRLRDFSLLIVSYTCSACLMGAFYFVPSCPPRRVHPPYKVYQGHLGSLTYAHVLWEPDLGDLHEQIDIRRWR